MKQIVNQIMYLIVQLTLSRILHLNKYLKVHLIVYHRVFRILYSKITLERASLKEAIFFPIIIS